jgi:hypothetical protein
MTLGQVLYDHGFRFGYGILDRSRIVAGSVFAFIALFFAMISIGLVRYRFKLQKK